ncbi:MAG: 5-oxoprolinase subunit PxpB [Pseudomonadota bacterium]
MCAELTLKRIADDVFEIDVDGPAAAQAIAHRLREAGMAEDFVPGLRCVAVRMHPARAPNIEMWLSAVSQRAEPLQTESATVEIVVRYGGEHGPDLSQVCGALDLSADAFIEMHTGAKHTVDMMGFTPGFAYLSSLEEGMQIPRLGTPRPRVAAGSVGISSGYTGLYALDGPGGWPLIGRTEAVLFSPDQRDPFLLAPGRQVRFRAA